MAAFAAVADVVDYPAVFSRDEVQGVNSSVRIFTRFWKGELCGYRAAAAFVEFLFEFERFVQISFARLAGLVDRLKGKPVAEKWFVRRILFKYAASRLNSYWKRR